MKNKSYYTIDSVNNSILNIPTVKIIKDNCIRVDFEYEADLCVELETTHHSYKSYGSKCPV